MPFVKKGVVIPDGGASDIDSSWAYNGSVVRFHNKYYCYYLGYTGSIIRICLAISKDGVHFIKKGAVLGLGAVGEIDDIGSVAPEILKSNNKDYLFYTGNDGAVTRICYGSAKDGIHFTRKGVVIGVGAGGEIDDGGLYGPSVFLNNNKFNMLYDGSDGASNRICYAMSN